VRAEAGAPFNHVLINRYRTGEDSMGLHADDEPELGASRPGVTTAVISDRELFRRLPPGLCATLLAVPVG
jgi:hypothetical protein